MSCPQHRMVFVTVGTTKFDALIDALDDPEVLRLLREHGFTSLRIQLGRGQVLPKRVRARPAPPAGEPFAFPCDEDSELADTIPVDFYSVKPSHELWADLDNASLVISHAGAGSVMEAMRRRRPLLVVVNSLLMGNHQAELAHALAEGKHLCLCSEPSELKQKLAGTNWDGIVPYPDPDLRAFPQLLDSQMGFK